MGRGATGDIPLDFDMNIMAGLMKQLKNDVPFKGIYIMKLASR